MIDCRRPLIADVGSSSSFHFHDVVRLPRLVVKLGTAAVESNGDEKGAAFQRLDPVFLVRGLRLGRPEKGQFPPVKAFWSVTLYDPDFFVAPNSINRYELSQRNKSFTNPDGSVDMYLQAESPGKAKEANWLPAPKGKFVLVMRLYWPTNSPPSILDGSWTPPGARRVD